MWRAVPTYEGMYEANRELHAVRSLDRIVMDRRGQVRRLRGRMLAGKGYQPISILLYRNGIGVQYTVDEVIDMTFGGAQIPA